MAVSADTRAGHGASSERPKLPPSASVRAPLGPTTALTVTLAVACFTIVMALVELLDHPRPAPSVLLRLGQKQNAETALYLTAFAMIVPIALILVPRLADAVSTTPNGEALSALAALLVASFAASILLARLLFHGSVASALGVVTLWSVATIGVLTRARQPRPWDPLRRIARLTPVLWALAGALVLGSLLAFSFLSSISLLPLAVGAVATAALVLVYARRGAPRPRVSRRLGAPVDGAIIGAILLAVPNLEVFKVAKTASPFLKTFQISVVQFHQDFVLGPVNQVIHGGAMLIDTASQYGVGSIYFLAGWFKIAPIGYGTLGLLDGILFALLFVAAYCLLRLAQASRTLAGLSLAVGVVVLIYNLVYSVGSLPAQHGPLRFGLPMIVVLAATLEARWPRHGRAARAAALLVVGVSSIWALEACAYTLVTYAAIACLQAWTGAGGRRRAWLVRQAALALGACIVTHVCFVAATLAFTGRLPDYGQYLAFLNAFMFGTVGNITFDFSRWSPALAVGVAYATSAVAFVLLVRRRRDIVERERPALIALCGTTAYGIILFSYFVDRSADHILPYVSLPALLAGALWLSLLLRGALSASHRMRLGGLAFALSLSVLLTSVAWSSVGDRFSRSALGHLLAGGETLGADLRHMWRLPALDPRTPLGEQLVGRFMPHRQRVLSLVSPDLETEIFIRTGHTNALPLTYPTEDSFVSSQYLPGLRRAVDHLRPGDRLFTQVDGLDVFAALQAQPSRDPISHPVASQLAPLQQWVLQRIGARFDLKVIRRDDQAFVVATLAPRP